MHKKVTVSETDYPAWPVTTLGATIVEADAKGSGQITFQTSDKLVSGGVWGCSPGTFELTFGWDEMCYILEGEASVEADGQTINLKPGDFAFFESGTKALWIVKRAIKKVFALRSAEPMG